MTLKIISAEKVVYQGEADKVTLPGANGQFTVLRNHAALVSTLTAGQVRYSLGSAPEQTVDIPGGLADIDSNVVSVCVY